jgi:hypothetical protein
LVFILSLMVFMVTLNAQQTQTQATIEANSARRDAQMNALQQTMNNLLREQGDTTRTNRAIACILAFDPTERSDEALAQCFHEQGLTAP